MKQAFVPFMSLSSASGQGAVDQTLAASVRAAFKPVQSNEAAERLEEDRAVPSGHHPTIKLDREGDAVRRIHIQCSCGQVIEIDCQY